VTYGLGDEARAGRGETLRLGEDSVRGLCGLGVGGLAAGGLGVDGLGVDGLGVDRPLLLLLEDLGERELGERERDDFDFRREVVLDDGVGDDGADLDLDFFLLRRLEERSEEEEILSGVDTERRSSLPCSITSSQECALLRGPEDTFFPRCIRLIASLIMISLRVDRGE